MLGGQSILVLFGVLGWALAPDAVLAQGAPVRLALLAVDQPGPYFDVTMQPGEQRTFSVELADTSSVPLVVRTYAADVYTIVNGGFGGRLRDEPRTAMTAWLDYPAGMLALEPGQHVRRSFTVTVPIDAGPGEYITSVVLENDAAVQGDGSLVIDQVVRQAVAVVVTLPGVRVPALTIGGAIHRDVAGVSVISVAVANPGNVRLRPAVAFALFDTAGTRVSTASLQMDTFYSWTDTRIEVPLAARLLPGGYTVRLNLDDSLTGATAEDLAIPLIVDVAAAGPAGDGSGGQLAPVDQGSAIAGGLFVPAILAAGGLLALACGGAFALTRSRRRGRLARR